MALTRAALIACLLAVSVSSGAVAQSFGLDGEHDFPVWMRGWSGLRLAADLPRRLPGAGVAISSLVFGAPRVGTFWTAGNPAGLVDGIRDTRSDFTAGWSRQRGDYRRPLDPGAARLMQGGAQAWKGFSPTFSMLGRVELDQERLDPGTRANATTPYGSSPFVTVDTAGTGVRRTRAVLEGVAGWKLGRWGLGVTVGFEARDHSTILSGVVRRVTGSTPGLVLGATRRLGGVEFGVQGRYRHRAEEIRVFERTQNARVLQLTAYSEAIPVDLIEPYFRRTEEDASAFGANLSGKFDRVTWAAVAEVTKLQTRLSRQRINDPATDRWNASGWEARGEVQRPLGSRGLLTLHARIVSVSGDGDLVTDSSGVIFTADESAFETEAELRLLPAERGWAGTLTVGWARESRQRQDLGAQLGSNISATTPSVALELGRTVGSSLFVSVGGAMAAYGPTSVIANPASRGPVYRYYIAPELDLYASRATPTALSFLLQYRTGKAATLWLSGRAERLSSSESAPLSAFTPSGSRTASSFAGGIMLR